MCIDLYLDIISIFVLKIKILWMLNNKKNVYFVIGYLNVSDIIGILFKILSAKERPSRYSFNMQWA